MSSQTERLVHILLCEEIGAERVPDVTQRVLRRALQRKRRSWLRLAAVAAGLVVCVLAGWWIAGRRYPAPEASGSYKLVGAADVCRGAVLVTAKQPASLALGGYCKVRLEPNTTLRIEGKKDAEEVRLEKGTLTCDVDPGIGTFAVRSRVGTVSVLGTSFSVKLSENKGAGTAPGSRQSVWMLDVAVTTGRVRVDYNGGVFTLSAGSRQIFGAGPGPAPNQPPPSRGAEKTTITGMAKALGGASGKLNPAAANATLTVTTGDTQVVYYVYGWAGVILAKQADGKKAEVSGVVADKDGRKTITGKSVDVKIIVVEEEPAKNRPH